MGVFEDVMAQSSRKPDGLTGVLDRRQSKRLPQLRVSTTSLTSHLWELELLPAFALVRLSGDISALSKRALDQNIFFESEVLNSAWPRLTNLLAPHGCWMLCLWETTGKARELRFFMPVRLNKVGLPRRKVLQSLSNDYMPLGTPLIDAECAGETAETLLRLLGDPSLKLPPVIDYSHQRKPSATLDALSTAAASLGLKSAENLTHERAALFQKDQPEEFLKSALGKKRLRELARQLRKLEESGPTEFEVASTQDAVLDAFEGFMTLELKGWKGQQGTALYNHKKIAAFSRQIVAELAQKKGCEIFSLKHNGKIVAALITLGRNGHFVPWKMAFDEKLSHASPGMQIMLQATQTLVRRETFMEADSLAVEDHWMMNRIWPDRITITDMAVALTSAGDKELLEVSKSKKRLFDLKKGVKTIWSSLASARKRIGKISKKR